MGDHHHGPAKGLSRWLYTTQHKDIGTMYYGSHSMFLLGGAFAMVTRRAVPARYAAGRAWLLQPDDNLAWPCDGLWPSCRPVGLANWLIPMMISAPDMALPHMNNWVSGFFHQHS